jgi:hypothetical protein
MAKTARRLAAVFLAGLFRLTGCYYIHKPVAGQPLPVTCCNSLALFHPFFIDESGSKRSLRSSLPGRERIKNQIIP